MSDPGMTLEQYQQMQDLQKRQALAAKLMTSNGAGGAYGGLANAGNSLLGAALASRAQTDQQNFMDKARYSAMPDQNVALGQTPGAGGQGFDLGSINAKGPFLPTQKPGMFSNLKNMFGFGGGA